MNNDFSKHLIKKFNSFSATKTFELIVANTQQLKSAKSLNF